MSSWLPGCVSPNDRFIPDDMSFDDREPKSVAIETSIPAGYTPPESVVNGEDPVINGV